MVRFNSLRSMLLASCAALIGGGNALAQDANGSSLLDEVIVTATKRDESVRDISGSVTAISGKQLEALGAQSFADYIARAPGVVFNDFQPGTSHVVVRGIATSAGNVQGQGTTGYYINEVPLTEPGWTIVIPDVDAFDVSHVEILRGPQGSLYGSASMGGAINYVANKASASAFDAAVEGTLSQTRNADVSYAGKAMVNIPLVADKLAVRGVVAYRQEQGYLDNMGIGKNGSSDIAVGGGRLSVVWTPTDNTELSWLSLYQKTDADDAPNRNPAIGDLKRSTAIAEPNVTDVELHSLRVDHDLGFAKFTAIGAYQEKSQDYLFDYTPVRGAYNADLGLNLTSPLYIKSGGESEGRSVEARLASPKSDRFEWLVGAMYFESDKHLYEALGAAGAAAQFNASPLFGPGSGAVIAPNGEIFNAFYSDISAKETALFGEASYYLTPQIKLTGGGRLFKTQIESTSTQVGFSTYPGAPIVTPSKDKQDGFSPKVSVTYTPNEDAMIYALYSEGFRFGTPNTPGLSAYPIPAGSSSDSLKNYEVGARLNPAPGFQFDVTAFSVKWADIQLRLQTPDFFNYAANGGSAKSNGVEVSSVWQATDKLDLSSSVTYMKARLTEPLFILWYGTAPEGARLPGSADWSISNVVSYRFGGAYKPVLTASHRYLSSGISDLNSAVPGVTPSEQGGYNLFDLRMRASFGKTSVSLFGANITDKRGVTRTVPDANGLSQGLVRPRTFGVTVNWAL